MTVRKLNRLACPAPACLKDYHPGAQTWQDLSTDHRAEIRAQLQLMQGERCAYCEGDIGVLGQHIEHFYPKAAYPARTFDWTNLYWSCDRTDSCGHFKDGRGAPYNVAHLIEPCVNDPDDFFIFRADGTISVRPGLSAQDENRARETLRVFALDANRGRLRAMRKAAVSGYVQLADEAFSAGFSAGEIRILLAEELQVTTNLPFSTAIRHVLTKRT